MGKYKTIFGQILNLDWSALGSCKTHCLKLLWIYLYIIEYMIDLPNSPASFIAQRLSMKHFVECICKYSSP